jgi:putative oxidoreductase
MVKHLQDAQPTMLSILRIAIGLVIFSFGTAKILHFHPGPFTPPPGSLPWIAGLLELVLGFLLLIGFQTRAAAFLLSGEMAFAYLSAISRRAFSQRKTADMPQPYSALFSFTSLPRAQVLSVSMDECREIQNSADSCSW